MDLAINVTLYGVHLPKSLDWFMFLDDSIEISNVKNRHQYKDCELKSVPVKINVWFLDKNMAILDENLVLILFAVEQSEDFFENFQILSLIFSLFYL